MTYKAKVAVCSEAIIKQRRASTTYYFLMLNLVVRKETARLWKVKNVWSYTSTSPVCRCGVDRVCQGHTHAQSYHATTCTL